MAAGRHNLTRRALLGVVAGVWAAPAASHAQRPPPVAGAVSRRRSEVVEAILERLVRGEAVLSAAGCRGVAGEIAIRP